MSLGNAILRREEPADQLWYNLIDQQGCVIECGCIECGH